jgi:hypothetical protein
MVAHLNEEVNISILTFLKISHELDCDFEMCTILQLVIAYTLT